MAEVGYYYITIMPEMSKFTGEVKKALGDLGTQSGTSFNKTFTDVLKGSAIGTLLGQAISSFTSEIASGLDVGIKRLDTIENFPKVMEALGYSTSEADRSVDLIMEHLDGLPTATQDMVTLTKAIADSTGDLDLATRSALGFNDMMLANGATAGEMTQAMGVFNRVLGKQNATVAQWQSLQSVMPAQLAMVARELMGEDASVEALRDALNDGSISWNDFLRAIVRLDEEGSGSVASFTEQAKANVHGIGTAIDNVKNRIGAGWAEILRGLGREDISGAIDKMSYGIRNAMTTIGKAIEWLKFTILGSSIDESVVRIFNSIKDAFGELDKVKLKNFARGAIDVVEGGLKWLADHGDLVASVVVGITGAIAGLVSLKIAGALASIPGILTAIWGLLTANPLVAFVTVVTAAYSGLKYFFTQTEAGKAVLESLKQVWTNLCNEFKAGIDQIKQNFEDNKVVWEQFKQKVVETVAGVVNGVQLFVNAIVSDFINMVAQIKQNLAANKLVWENFKRSVVNTMTLIKTSVLLAWNVIKTSITTTINNIKTTSTVTWNAIKTIITTVIGNIKTAVSAGVNTVKSVVNTSWNLIKTISSTVWNGIKTVVSNAISNTKSTVSTTVDNIKSKISDTFNSAKTAALSAFDGIKNGIKDRIDGAKRAVSDAIDRIKSILSGSISFPHINLPHFSVYGGEAPYGIGGKGSLPRISVEWYAKGGVFNAPTLIGVGEGRSSEAVLPLNDATYGAIAEGISSRMAASSGATVTITGNTFVVRQDSDIDRIADELAVRIARQMGAGAW